jgi:intracellular septation protein
VMSAGLLISLWVFKHNLMHKMLGAQMQLPALVWRRLVYLWATFFAGMGCLNLFVAYQFSTATWVNFKMFGALGLMIAFVVGQSIYISRHAMQAANDE